MRSIDATIAPTQPQAAIDTFSSVKKGHVSAKICAPLPEDIITRLTPNITVYIKMCEGKPDSLNSRRGMNAFDPQIGSITELLRRIESGDTDARDELFEQVYSRLKALARPKLRGANRELLQTTAVVNEACGRLVKDGIAVSAKNRGELFTAANRAIQWVLIDYARKRLAQKRIADRDELIEDAIRRSELAVGVDFIDLQESLKLLRERHERVARVIEARFFGGLTMQQAAEVCGVSVDTAKRDWRFGRAFLHARLSR